MKKSKRNKAPPRHPYEIVGYCIFHTNDPYVRWEKARTKCLKQFNNKCPHFRKLGG